MADPRIATVLHIMEAYASADVQGMQPHMSAAVVLEAVGNNPLAGTYEGIGSVLAFAARSMATFVTGSVELQQVEARGDQVQVLVAGDVALVGGDTYPVKVLQRYWFGAEGKVERIRAEAAENPEEFDRILTEQARLL